MNKSKNGTPKLETGHGSPHEVTLIVDVATKRPGCVLLQAAYGMGEDATHFVSATFDSADWILSPTDKMAKVTGTIAEWQQHAVNLRKKREQTQ